MSRLSLMIGLLAAGMILGGCASTPWTPPKIGPWGWVNPSFDNPSTAKKSPPDNIVKKLPATQPNNQTNAQAMLEIMDELRQIGALDPAAENKLIEDLKQTDPTLWPLVMQQFRAAIAYKRRLAERDAMAANDIHSNKSYSSTNSSLNAVAANLPGNSDTIPRAGKGLSPLPIPNPAQAATAQASTVSPVNNPVTVDQSSDSRSVQKAVDEQPADKPANPVISTSYNTTNFSKPADWKEYLLSSIKALESSASSDPKTTEEQAQQARLRMLYILADRRDDALKPIPTAPPAIQEFWSKELYGLAMLLDCEAKTDATSRAVESKRILGEALSRLGEAAPLAVRNLNFCTAVQSYGCYTPFKKYEFTPDQEVLLYAEMDNYAAESTSKGFHTLFRSSYQILDAGGNRVADHTFTSTEEYCQNPRHDFFIGFHLRMPQRINPGKYTLQLTVEDLKSNKVGQSSIEFTIKEAEK